MKDVKKYLKDFKIIIFILVYSLVLTLINLVSPMDSFINSIIGYGGILLFSLVSGIKKGMLRSNKGYLGGLKLGIINVLILYIGSLLFLSYKMNLRRLIYYVVILMVTILGSIIGINRKK